MATLCLREICFANSSDLFTPFVGADTIKSTSDGLSREFLFSSSCDWEDSEEPSVDLGCCMSLNVGRYIKRSGRREKQGEARRGEGKKSLFLRQEILISSDKNDFPSYHRAAVVRWQLRAFVKSFSVSSLGVIMDRVVASRDRCRGSQQNENIKKGSRIFSNL